MTCEEHLQSPAESDRQIPLAGVLSKREIFGLVLILIAVGAVALVAHVAGINLCLFRRLTGFPCLCCGTTRACLAILRGDVVGALTYNPLAVAIIFLGPFVVWLMTLRKTWPRAVVVTAMALAWIAVALDWVYLLFRDLSQV